MLCNNLIEAYFYVCNRAQNHIAYYLQFLNAGYYVSYILYREYTNPIYIKKQLLIKLIMKKLAI